VLLPGDPGQPEALQRTKRHHLALRQWSDPRIDRSAPAAERRTMRPVEIEQAGSRCPASLYLNSTNSFVLRCQLRHPLAQHLFGHLLFSAKSTRTDHRSTGVNPMVGALRPPKNSALEPNPPFLRAPPWSKTNCARRPITARSANQQRETRSPKHATRAKRATRNAKPAARNPQPATRNSPLRYAGRQTPKLR